MASYEFSGQPVPGQTQYTDQYHDAGGYDPHGAEGGAEALQAGGFGRMLNILGAAGSLALVVGIGVWGYKLVMRDVSGVPVVRAIEGPMRIQPDDPGGQPADHQGLAVNSVAAQGVAAPPADRLILAPRPVSLADEDAAMGALKPVQAVLKVEQEITDHQAANLRQDAVDALVNELAGPDAPVITPAEEGVQVAALTVPEEDPAIDPADLVAERPQVALLDEPGVSTSLRPLPRPARSVRAPAAKSDGVQAAINAAVRAAAGLDVDPDSLAAGTRLAQLGAFESAEVARAEWDRLDGSFGEYLDGKQRVIQKASSGGRTFYRLRALGFEDLSDSRQFCAALVSRGADCIPVSVR